MARLFVVVLALSALIGCRSQEQQTRGSDSHELVVFAAASLTDAFTAVEKDFEGAHPKIDVKLSFAGSQSLRTQIENGAAANLFASANAQHMDALEAAHLVETPIIFVQNELVIVVPEDNPAGIRSLADLPKAKRLVLADKHVPAGAYATKMLESANAEYGADFATRVDARVVSRETHVRQTLQKVVLGEADAAIVYATDAKSAGDAVVTIAIPAKHNVVASYPIAPIADTKRRRLGQRFIEHLRSDEGIARLREFGFRAPHAGQ